MTKNAVTRTLTQFATGNGTRDYVPFPYHSGALPYHLARKLDYQRVRATANHLATHLLPDLPLARARRLADSYYTWKANTDSTYRQEREYSRIAAYIRRYAHPYYLPPQETIERAASEPKPLSGHLHACHECKRDYDCECGNPAWGMVCEPCFVYLTTGKQTEKPIKVEFVKQRVSTWKGSNSRKVRYSVNAEEIVPSIGEITEEMQAISDDVDSYIARTETPAHELDSYFTLAEFNAGDGSRPQVVSSSSSRKGAEFRAKLKSKEHPGSTMSVVNRSQLARAEWQKLFGLQNAENATVPVQPYRNYQKRGKEIVRSANPQ